MKKNILVVDDSALMRRVICDIIDSDSTFQVKDIWSGAATEITGGRYKGYGHCGKHSDDKGGGCDDSCHGVRCNRLCHKTV